MNRQVMIAMLGLGLGLAASMLTSCSSISSLTKQDWDKPILDWEAAARKAPKATAALKRIKDGKVKPKLLKETLIWDKPGTYDYTGQYFKASVEKGSPKENRAPIGAILADNVTVRGLVVVGRIGHSHDGIHYGNRGGQWSSTEPRNGRMIDCALPQGEDTVTLTVGTRDAMFQRCLFFTEDRNHGSQHDKHFQINGGEGTLIQSCYFAGETANSIECKGRTSGTVISSVFADQRTVVQHDTNDKMRTLRQGRSEWDLRGVIRTGQNKELVSAKGDFRAQLPAKLR